MELNYRVWGIVLERAYVPSSLVMSLNTAVELLEDHIDAAVTNGVH
jgi:hypothetical protein